MGIQILERLEEAVDASEECPGQEGLVKVGSRAAPWWLPLPEDYASGES
jgi:hypothetical protein